MTLQMLSEQFNIHQELWLQALESGDYIQCFSGYMFTVDKESKQHLYCPLGIACHILDRNKTPKGQSLSHPHHKHHVLCPRAPAMKKLCLTPEGESLLQALNDQENLPLQLIAETVRSKPWKFFSNFKEALCPIT